MLIENYSNAESCIEIEAFVGLVDTSLIYATPRFMGMLTAHLDADARWLVYRESNVIVAVLPYLIKKSEYGEVYNSLAYYGSNGGVIQIKEDLDVKERLIKSFYIEAKKNGAVSATIISNPLEEYLSYEKHSDFDFRDERIGQITHLPSHEEIDSLLSIYSNPRPRNIRKAIREGVSVTENHSDEAIGFLFETHAANMAAIGGLPKKRSFYDSISGFLSEKQWSIYIASKDNSPISALLLFYHNGTVEYFTPVVVESHRSTQALTLIIFEAMRDAITRGYKKWNWGGTWLSQGGVYDFKKKWGTTDYPYFYYTKVFDMRIKKLKRVDLLTAFEGFYVLPYEELDES